MKLTLTVLAMSAALPVSAATLDYTVDFTALNDPDANARAFLSLDTATQMLDVAINGSGFVPGVPHIAHIHGFTDTPVVGSRVPSFDPNVADPASTTVNNTPDSGEATINDGDGTVELLEALSSYGPIRYTFGDMANDADELIPGFGGIAADADGNIDFMQSGIDLTGTGILDNGYTLADREIVIHGIQTTDAPIDFFGVGTGGGVDPSRQVDGYYNVALPAVAGEIAPVPLPAAAWLLIGSIGGLGALRARRRT